MRITPEQRAKRAVLAINMIRQNKNSFNIKELISDLHNADCPYSARVPQLLLNLKLLEKNGKTYTFPSTEPIYFRQIQDAMHKISNAKQVLNVAAQLKPIVSEEESMITFLKNKGYRILRPEFVEC